MNERELARLKVELEQVDYEEFEELRKQVETLTFKFNELLDWLGASFGRMSKFAEDVDTDWTLLKVKSK